MPSSKLILTAEMVIGEAMEGNQEYTGILVSWFPAFDWNVSVNEILNHLKHSCFDVSWLIEIVGYLRRYWTCRKTAHFGTITLDREVRISDTKCGRPPMFFCIALKVRMKPTGNGKSPQYGWNILELQTCIPALKGFVKRPPEGVLACHCRPTKGISQPLR